MGTPKFQLKENVMDILADLERRQPRGRTSTPPAAIPKNRLQQNEPHTPPALTSQSRETSPVPIDHLINFLGIADDIQPDFSSTPIQRHTEVHPQRNVRTIHDFLPPGTEKDHQCVEQVVQASGSGCKLVTFTTKGHTNRIGNSVWAYPVQKDNPATCVLELNWNPNVHAASNDAVIYFVEETTLPAINRCCVSTSLHQNSGWREMLKSTLKNDRQQDNLCKHGIRIPGDNLCKFVKLMFESDRPDARNLRIIFLSVLRLPLETERKVTAAPKSTTGYLQRSNSRQKLSSPLARPQRQPQPQPPQPQPTKQPISPDQGAITNSGVKKVKSAEQSETAKKYCSACNDVIEGDYTRAFQKPYHPSCFRCASCNEQIISDVFRLHANSVYHTHCVPNSGRTGTPSNPQTSPNKGSLIGRVATPTNYKSPPKSRTLNADNQISSPPGSGRFNDLVHQYQQQAAQSVPQEAPPHVHSHVAHVAPSHNHTLSRRQSVDSALVGNMVNNDGLIHRKQKLKEHSEEELLKMRDMLLSQAKQQQLGYTHLATASNNKQTTEQFNFSVNGASGLVNNAAAYTKVLEQQFSAQHTMHQQQQHNGHRQTHTKLFKQSHHSHDINQATTTPATTGLLSPSPVRDYLPEATNQQDNDRYNQLQSPSPEPQQLSFSSCTPSTPPNAKIPHEQVPSGGLFPQQQQQHYHNHQNTSNNSVTDHNFTSQHIKNNNKVSGHTHSRQQIVPPSTRNTNSPPRRAPQYENGDNTLLSTPQPEPQPEPQPDVQPYGTGRHTQLSNSPRDRMKKRFTKKRSSRVGSQDEDCTSLDELECSGNTRRSTPRRRRRKGSTEFTQCIEEFVLPSDGQQSTTAALQRAPPPLQPHSYKLSTTTSPSITPDGTQAGETENSNVIKELAALQQQIEEMDQQRFMNTSPLAVASNRSESPVGGRTTTTTREVTTSNNVHRDSSPPASHRPIVGPSDSPKARLALSSSVIEAKHTVQTNWRDTFKPAEVVGSSEQRPPSIKVEKEADGHSEAGQSNSCTTVSRTPDPVPEQPTPVHTLATASPAPSSQENQQLSIMQHQLTVMQQQMTALARVISTSGIATPIQGEGFGGDNHSLPSDIFMGTPTRLALSPPPQSTNPTKRRQGSVTPPISPPSNSTETRHNDGSSRRASAPTAAAHGKVGRPPTVPWSKHDPLNGRGLGPSFSSSTVGSMIEYGGNDMSSPVPPQPNRSVSPPHSNATMSRSGSVSSNITNASNTLVPVGGGGGPAGIGLGPGGGGGPAGALMLSNSTDPHSISAGVGAKTRSSPRHWVGTPGASPRTPNPTSPSKARQLHQMHKQGHIGDPSGLSMELSFSPTKSIRTTTSSLPSSTSAAAQLDLPARPPAVQGTLHEPGKQPSLRESLGRDRERDEHTDRGRPKERDKTHHRLVSASERGSHHHRISSGSDSVVRAKSAHTKPTSAASESRGLAVGTTEWEQQREWEAWEKDHTTTPQTIHNTSELTINGKPDHSECIDSTSSDFLLTRSPHPQTPPTALQQRPPTQVVSSSGRSAVHSSQPAHVEHSNTGNRGRCWGDTGHQNRAKHHHQHHTLSPSRRNYDSHGFNEEYQQIIREAQEASAQSLPQYPTVATAYHTPRPTSKPKKQVSNEGHSRMHPVMKNDNRDDTDAPPSPVSGGGSFSSTTKSLKSAHKALNRVNGLEAHSNSSSVASNTNNNNDNNIVVMAMTHHVNDNAINPHMIPIMSPQKVMKGENHVLRDIDANIDLHASRQGKKSRVIQQPITMQQHPTTVHQQQQGIYMSPPRAAPQPRQTQQHPQQQQELSASPSSVDSGSPPIDYTKSLYRRGSGTGANKSPSVSYGVNTARYEATNHNNPSYPAHNPVPPSSPPLSLSTLAHNSNLQSHNSSITAASALPVPVPQGDSMAHHRAIWTQVKKVAAEQGNKVVFYPHCKFNNLPAVLCMAEYYIYITTDAQILAQLSQTHSHQTVFDPVARSTMCHKVLQHDLQTTQMQFEEIMSIGSCSLIRFDVDRTLINRPQGINGSNTGNGGANRSFAVQKFMLLYHEDPVVVLRRFTMHCDWLTIHCFLDFDQSLYKETIDDVLKLAKLRDGNHEGLAYYTHLKNFDNHPLRPFFSTLYQQHQLNTFTHNGHMFAGKASFSQDAGNDASFLKILITPHTPIIHCFQAPIDETVEHRAFQRVFVMLHHENIADHLKRCGNVFAGYLLSRRCTKLLQDLLPTPVFNQVRGNIHNVKTNFFQPQRGDSSATSALYMLNYAVKHKLHSVATTSFGDEGEHDGMMDEFHSWDQPYPAEVHIFYMDPNDFNDIKDMMRVIIDEPRVQYSTMPGNQPAGLTTMVV